MSIEKSVLLNRATCENRSLLSAAFFVAFITQPPLQKVLDTRQSEIKITTIPIPPSLPHLVLDPSVLPKGVLQVLKVLVAIHVLALEVSELDLAHLEKGGRQGGKGGKA